MPLESECTHGHLYNGPGEFTVIQGTTASEGTLLVLIITMNI